MPVELSDRSTTIRPSPFVPRRKSTSRSVCCDVAGPRLGEALHRLRLGVELLALVEQRDQDGVALDLRLERLRPVEVEHDARPVAGLDHVEAAQRRRRRSCAASAPRPLPVSRKSSAMRGGLAIAKPAGGLAGGVFSVNLTTVSPGAALRRPSPRRCCWSPARTPRRQRAAPAQRSEPRARAARPSRPRSRRCQAKRTRSFSSLLCLRVGLDAAAACSTARSSRRRRPARVPSA